MITCVTLFILRRSENPKFRIFPFCPAVAPAKNTSYGILGDTNYRACCVFGPQRDRVRAPEKGGFAYSRVVVHFRKV